MKFKNLLILSGAMFASIFSFSQNNCPSFPKVGKFDTLSFIKTEIPTDAKDGKVAGNIYLGQGYVTIPNRGYKSPAFIPNNKPTWALAVAHAWNYHRNIIKRVNYPQIGYYLATALQETELGCVPGATWDAGKTSPMQVNAQSVMQNNGCFQIEGPFGGYSLISQTYVNNRFPSDSYNTLVQSTTGFETSALVKTYYDIITPYIYNYYYSGWKVFESIDCTKDKYAYIKSSASAFSGGVYSFASNSSFFNKSKDTVSNWTGLTGNMAGYPDNIAKITSVLENDINYRAFPANSNFDSYYNSNISWANVTDYLTIIKYMYPEIDFTKVVTPKVQAAYEKIAGSTSNTIAFSKLGPVIDQIILALPAEYPSPTDANNSKCLGKELPFGHIEIVSGSQQLNLGNSITLLAVVDAGAGANLNYKWFQGNTQIGTSSTVTINPAAPSQLPITAQICNGTDCYQLNTNTYTSCTDSINKGAITINVAKNFVNNITLAANPTNIACKGMTTGNIKLTLVNAPASYTVMYDGVTSLGKVSGSFVASGSTATISNLTDGTYNISITSEANTAIKAFASTTITATTSQTDYVDAKITSVSNCVANVEAKALALPNQCKFTVQAWAPDYFYWENYINLGVTKNGATTFDVTNKTYPTGQFDTYNKADIVEKTYYLNAGEVLSFSLANSATQSLAYTVKVLDNTNTQVYTASAPAGSAKNNAAPYRIGSFTATCPTTPSNTYTFAWSPVINQQTDSPVNAANKSVGNVGISPINDRVFTVTATSKSNNSCVFTDTANVLKNPVCSSLTGIDDLNISQPKEVIKIYNLFGQEAIENEITHGIYIYLYSDGSREKILK